MPRRYLPRVHREDCRLAERLCRRAAYVLFLVLERGQQSADVVREYHRVELTQRLDGGPPVGVVQVVEIL